MKNARLWLGIGSLGLLSACASYYAPLPPVGPVPVISGSAAPGCGSLVVYSAWSCFDDYKTSDHSGYTIYSKDGKRVKWVPNFIEGDFVVEPPTRVSLPAGFYKIKAEGGKYGWVTVPAVIEEGRTTYVYLDGEAHAIDSLANRKDLVKLPDGEIVGWAANPPLN